MDFTMQQVTARIQVVPAEMADLERLLPVFGAYRECCGVPPALHECRYFLFNRLMNEDSMILLAEAPEDSKLLGFAQLYPTFSSLALNQIWLLSDLYVRSECRRQGVATRLIEYARDFLTERGDDAIVMEVTPDNTAAQTLCKGMGFKPDTSFRRCGLSLGKRA